MFIPDLVSALRTAGTGPVPMIAGFDTRDAARVPAQLGLQGPSSAAFDG